MYLRTIARKNRNGSTVRYLQLAHNQWDPKSRCAKAQVLYSFGREDELDREAVRRLVHSLSRLLDPAEAAKVEAKSTGAGLTMQTSRALGGAWLLDQLWRRLGLDKTLQELWAHHRFSTRMERAIFAMVANRALDPSSKLAMEDWVGSETVIPGLGAVEVKTLYRAMDFVLGAAPAIEQRVYWAVADLLNLEVDLLYFDTTSTYFETAVEDGDDAEGGRVGLRERGHSKDHRDDLPQVVIGLAVTRTGIPIRCWVWPGNTADMSVVEEVKRDLVNWKLGRVIAVVDRGFVSEENLRMLQRAGGHYIAGERMRAGKPEVEAALSRPGRYQKVRDNVEVKEVIVGEGEARHRYVLVRNPFEAEKQCKERGRILKELRERLKSLRQSDDGSHAKAVCALRAHPTYGRYLHMDAKGRLTINQDKVDAEERLDGKYLIRTSDDTLTAEDVALGYKQLAEVEAAFRTLKTTLDLRPVYHRLEERIRAHVLLCWLALLLIRICEEQTGSTWPKIRQAMQRMHLIEYKGPEGTVWQRTETTTEQNEILSQLKFEAPPRIFRCDPAASAQNA